MPDPFRFPPPMISSVPFAGPYSGASWASAKFDNAKVTASRKSGFLNMIPPFGCWILLQASGRFTGRTVKGYAVEEPDDRLPLLRACGKRPSRRAAEERDEL